MRTLKRKNLLYQAIQEEIKSYIIENALRPGDPLPPETELTNRLGVSRNSVREAVKALETLGILEAKPGSGLFVCDFSFDPLLENLAYGLMFDLDDLGDMLEVRFYVEYGMAERAIHAVTAEQLEKLVAILERMRASAEQGTYPAEADRAFHQALWKNVDNAVLGKILDVFWKVLDQAQQRAGIPDLDDPMVTYQRHVDIVEALNDQDEEAMARAMERHYVRIQERVKQMQEMQARAG